MKILHEKSTILNYYMCGLFYREKFICAIFQVVFSLIFYFKLFKFCIISLLNFHSD